MKKLQPVNDRRAGYQRQEDECNNSTFTCECGSRVDYNKLTREFVHRGVCTTSLTEFIARLDNKYPTTVVATDT